MIGLITARGGSERLPRKNIKMMAGKPMIAWTIEAALASKLERVILSTDDDEIAFIGSNWGAEVLFMLPPEMTQVKAPHLNVVIHAMRWLAFYEDYHPDYVMLLQPTSPLRTTEDIDNAIAMEREVISVDRDYRENGAIFVFRAENLLTQGGFSCPAPYVMAQSLDVDTIEDFQRGENELLQKVSYA